MRKTKEKGQNKNHNAAKATGSEGKICTEGKRGGAMAKKGRVTVPCLDFFVYICVFYQSADAAAEATPNWPQAGDAVFGGRCRRVGGRCRRRWPSSS